MSKVVVISGHPDLQSSYTNTVILDEIDMRLEAVQIRRLDQLYPDYQIDVEAEQQALVNADVVVLQFPFYWYSVPALLKKWIDDVFSYNFAYGAEGDKLKGKDIILSFTVGGPEESYDPLGYNHFSIEQLIRPLQQTAYLAGMNYSKPIYTHRMVYIPGVYNEVTDVQERARHHAEKLIQQVNVLLESPENLINKFVQNWFMNFDLLPEQTDSFTNSLASDLKLSMPEGTFIGQEGFRDWYAIARNTFKPNCQHIVEQTTVNELESGRFSVELRIRLVAETYEESGFKGETVNMLVDEQWELSLDEEKQITIHEYRVKPIAS